jgi:hypothetical protein
MRLAKQQGLITKFPNGRRPRGAPKLHPNRTVRRAQKIIEARMAKEPALRFVGDGPAANEIALEPCASPLEQSTATARAEGAESEGSAVATAESLGEAETLLEELLAALLDAPNPFNEADKHVSLWSLVADKLPGAVYNRIDAWIEKH